MMIVSKHVIFEKADFLCRQIASTNRSDANKKYMEIASDESKIVAAGMSKRAMQTENPYISNELSSMT